MLTLSLSPTSPDEVLKATPTERIFEEVRGVGLSLRRHAVFLGFIEEKDTRNKRLEKGTTETIPDLGETSICC